MASDAQKTALDAPKTGDTGINMPNQGLSITSCSKFKDPSKSPVWGGMDNWLFN